MHGDSCTVPVQSCGGVQLLTLCACILAAAEEDADEPTASICWAEELRPHTEVSISCSNVVLRCMIAVRTLWYDAKPEPRHSARQ